MDIFQDLALWCLGTNRYSTSEVLSFPPDILTILIENNQPKLLKFERLASGEMESRQSCIWNMIQDVCKKYKINDLIFAYNTHDRVYDLNSPCFTHARRKGTQTRNILAPCFTFYEYPEGPLSTPKSWSCTRDEILQNRVDWKDKEDICAFVGSLTQENHRIYNTSINFNPALKILDQPASSTNFIQRYELSKYKYLLHLNGHRGAYASRLKYLLGTESLVFYNYNSGSETNFWEEWWMKDTYFKPDIHYVSCETREIFKEKLNHYAIYQEDALQISKNGNQFFENYLTYDNVLLFWYYLLNTYASRLD